ncbi:MAG: MFS transporter [Proteiniphilum sp.]|nr:MFS transporter [Proteiniphilum sp.]
MRHSLIGATLLLPERFRLNRETDGAVALNQRKPYTGILFIIYGNMILYGFIQTMRGVIYPLVKNDFSVSYSRQGFLVFLVSFVSVSACAAAGFFLSRFGFRKSMAAGFTAVTAGMASFLFSPGSSMAGGFWITAGMIVLIHAGLGFFEIGLNGMGARTFTRNSALMMSLLHFFYGVGAVLGPLFAGFTSNGLGLNWRFIYPLGLVPVAVMALVTFFITPKDDPPGTADSPAGKTPSVSGKQFTFWSALRDPLVWQFGLLLGFVSAGEVGSANWSGLYLQDVYGYDPKTTGAAFLSLFYILYTSSRLLSGFVIEKTGYFRSLSIAACIIIVLFAAGFGLGKNGVWILPFTGFFLAICYPTLLAAGIGIFRERAQTASSAMIVISFSLGGVLQFLIGLVNRYIGEAWGYRCCLVYLIVFAILLQRLRYKITGAG